ncbi:MAG: FAD-dependent thymidylate synthase [Synergistaceae bacterium]|nr:FAD-dependent thymidylate synthase [Synergistaceae bacterium]
MKVKLVQHSELSHAVRAIRTCTGNRDRETTPESDARLIEQCLINGHHSVFEHVNYTFEITGVSRALLQELARHRHCSLSVKSTRFALGKMSDDDIGYIENFLNEQALRTAGDGRGEKYQALNELNGMVVSLFRKIQSVKREYPDVPNDILKYALPECMPTELTLSANARQMALIFSLRAAKRALMEFRRLVSMMHDEIHAATNGVHDLLFDHCGVDWAALREELNLTVLTMKRDGGFDG